MDGTIGEVRMFMGNFPPRGWECCHGQVLTKGRNTALPVIIGTTFGGNGSTTVALPDLRSRFPAGSGQGQGLPAVALGELSGEATHTLSVIEMPAHSHATKSAIHANASGGDTAAPQGAFPAASTARDNVYATTTDGSTMNAQAVQVTVGSAGGSQPHNNMPPFLGLNFIIYPLS